MAPEWVIQMNPDGVGLWIHVHPGARTDAVGPLYGDALRVAVRAAAVKGRANAACVGALAAALEVPPSSVILTAQSRGRRKRVRIQGNPAELAVRLRALASQG